MRDGFHSIQLGETGVGEKEMGRKEGRKEGMEEGGKKGRKVGKAHGAEASLR